MPFCLVAPDDKFSPSVNSVIRPQKKFSITHATTLELDNIVVLN